MSSQFRLNYIKNVDWGKNNKVVAIFCITLTPQELEVRECKLIRGSKGGFFVAFPDKYLPEEQWWTNDDGVIIKNQKLIHSTDEFQAEVLRVIQDSYDHTHEPYKKYSEATTSEMPL